MHKMSKIAIAMVLLLAGCGSVTATKPATAPTVGTSSCHARLPLPDPVCTPGARNPDVTQATIQSTICKSGWTATIRPTQAYTNKLKLASIKAYGYADVRPTLYEEDHFLPLELGGAPKDPNNLWAEPGPAGANPKDIVESAVKRLVCAGKVPLGKAQTAMLINWTTAIRQLGGK